MRTIVTFALGLLVAAPTLLAFSEGESLFPRLIGLFYALMLIYAVKSTKVGRRALKELDKANKKLLKLLNLDEHGD